MCGICGLVQRSPAEPERELLVYMAESMRHRGPDDLGVWSGPGAGLAMTRLAIIDLAGGHQPMTDERAELWAVANGEIYNFQELRHRLEGLGHRFGNRSDTEVLLHGYQQWGEEVVERLAGMFGFALWDPEQRKLLLGRDRLGIKPLHYCVQGDRLVFGSEIKAILRAPGVERRVNLEALHAYLTYNYVPAPLTMFQGIYKLPPGHLLTWQDGTVRVRRYWDLPALDPATARRSEGEYAEELLALLSAAVQSHLVSDVPLGVLLSGGVDSSALTALMARLGVKVQTFSIGFEEKSYDELGYARLVAGRYQTDHHEEVVRADAMALAPRLAAYLDEPFADSSAIPTYLVAQMARRHVTVVLSGEGGDEIFAGYQTYAADRIAEYYRRLPRPLREWVIKPAAMHLPVSTRKISFDYKAKRFVSGADLPAADRHQAWKVIFEEVEKAALYAPEVAAELSQVADPLDFARTYHQRSPATDLLGSMQYVDTKLYLPDDILVKTDRMSMANSLEARVPFLDHKVVEFAAALPPDLRLRRLTKKYILRKAVDPLLPRPVVWSGKRGFNVPVAAWLRGEMRGQLLDHLSAERMRQVGFFSPAAVQGLIDDHLQRRRDLSRNLWGLLMFEMWHDRYLEQQADLAPVAARQG